MSDMERPVIKHTFLNITTTPEFIKYYQTISQTTIDLNEARKAGAQEAITQLEEQAQKIRIEYLNHLIEEFVKTDRPDLPFLLFVDAELSKQAQQELTNRLTQKHNGNPPKGIPWLPEKSLLPALRQERMEKQNPTCVEIAFIGGEDRQWRAKPGVGLWNYTYKCRPRHCGWSPDETCPHGLMTIIGKRPPGWIDGKGWDEAYFHQGPAEYVKPAEHVEHGEEIESMDTGDD
ncbi:hypothetical protein K505DRAFT_389821 [Melanomma pulvis-pyrius CBS 109.77]|uniref:Uncharacterized protein n=1 Tax=Melanomma pulvis-pyrius CBS 109.77 TaxID=1314802 RepID=A0A6A6X4A7_9PLEO|nr:hypothetical protein K505DRAFT_389821 [Melanomma pulvis-pyrius CBS 109.77]